jgi:hypothetical protein
MERGAQNLYIELDQLSSSAGHKIPLVPNFTYSLVLVQRFSIYAMHARPEDRVAENATSKDKDAPLWRQR